MYELIQHIIAFKYACKINHWRSNDYATHIQCDRLSEGLDELADRISECYFMASGNKDVFMPNILSPDMISHDLVHMCETIIDHLEYLQSDKNLNEGMKSLLSSIEEEFLNKLALAKLS